MISIVDGFGRRDDRRKQEKRDCRTEKKITWRDREGEKIQVESFLLEIKVWSERP